jgi:hypothetical protein
MRCAFGRPCRREDASRSGARRSSSSPRAETSPRRPRRGEIARGAGQARAVVRQSNFHHHEFADLPPRQLKGKQGTVSLVPDPQRRGDDPDRPSLNPRDGGRVPLLDEVLVMDSTSTDRTRESPRRRCCVVQHPGVWPLRRLRGKGEIALEVALRDLGDLIVWADTDVRANPGLVYGTSRPSRAAPQYVKGYCSDRSSRIVLRGRRRAGLRARSEAARQPLLPDCRASSAAVGRVRRPARRSSRSRSSPGTRSRSGTSSTSPNGPGSMVSVRSTSSDSASKRELRACRG